MITPQEFLNINGFINVSKPFGNSNLMEAMYDDRKNNHINIAKFVLSSNNILHVYSISERNTSELISPIFEGIIENKEELKLLLKMLQLT